MTIVVNQLIILAIGGNAILRNNQKGLALEQFANISIICEHIASLIQTGYNVLIVHGNGPQIGDILYQNALCADLVPPMPGDICNARSQGQIGYMIQQTLLNVFKKRRITKQPVTLITQVLVDENDPGFITPTKPVGRFMTKDKIKKLKKRLKCEVVSDIKKGYRWVVPSPKPKKILEIDIIKELIKKDIVPITAGGGGIPVIEKRGTLIGCEGVIDKDLSAARLGIDIDADLLLILMDLPYVYLDYGLSTQKKLEKLTVTQAKNYLDKKQFATGSIGPKIQAAIEFVSNTGKKAVITSMEKIMPAVKFRAGTVILP